MCLSELKWHPGLKMLEYDYMSSIMEIIEDIFFKYIFLALFFLCMRLEWRALWPVGGIVERHAA